jgi:hypothetical protein
MDFPGLRRSGSWSQIIVLAQDIGEQASRDGGLRQLVRDAMALAHYLGADLDQYFPQSHQLPVWVLAV